MDAKVIMKARSMKDKNMVVFSNQLHINKIKHG
jgi:hypothetical protein